MANNSTPRTTNSKIPRRRKTIPVYAVGYGRPPLHSRFVSGKSGNPKGRPKGSLNLVAELKNELNRLITIREGDRSRRLKKGAAWIVRTVNGALNNDAKANATLVALLRAVVLGQPSQAPAEAPLTSDDQAILDAYTADVAARVPVAAPTSLPRRSDGKSKRRSRPKRKVQP